MADHSLKELSALINQQVTSRENLSIQLLKAKALLDIALDDHFSTHSTALIYAYLLTLDDVVEKARALNEESLDRLLKGTFSDRDALMAQH